WPSLPRRQSARQAGFGGIGSRQRSCNCGTASTDAKCSSHQTCRSQNCDVGLLAKRSLAFVEVPEVGRATDGNPGGLDEGPAKPLVAMWQQFALEGLTPAAAGGRTQTGVAAELLSRGEALDAVDLGDDHGGQDWSHTGQAAHVLECGSFLEQAFQGFLILTDTH